VLLKRSFNKISYERICMIMIPCVFVLNSIGIVILRALNHTSHLVGLATWTLIVMVVLLIIFMILHINSGINCVIKYDDAPFSRIDNAENCINSQEDYSYVVNIINDIYKEGGEVEQLINDGEVGRLFKRQDFLYKKMGFNEDIENIMWAIIVSTGVSYIFTTLNSVQNQFDQTVCLLLMLGFWVVLCLSLFVNKYNDKYNPNSYKLIALKYESDQLHNKIMSLSKGYSINELKFKMFEMREKLYELKTCDDNSVKCYKKEIKKIERIVNDVSFYGDLIGTPLIVESHDKRLFYVADKKGKPIDENNKEIKRFIDLIDENR